jgi:predicted membrane GTPase involved in stress response
MSALPTVELDPPTISMTFGVNDSPLAGRDGTHVSCVCVTFTFFTASVAYVKFFARDFPNSSSNLTLLS